MVINFLRLSSSGCTQMAEFQNGLDISIGNLCHLKVIRTLSFLFPRIDFYLDRNLILRIPYEISILLSLSIGYSLTTSVCNSNVSLTGSIFNTSRINDFRNRIPQPCIPSGFSRLVKKRHMITSRLCISNTSKML